MHTVGMHLEMSMLVYTYRNEIHILCMYLDIHTRGLHLEINTVGIHLEIHILHPLCSQDEYNMDVS